MNISFKNKNSIFLFCFLGKNTSLQNFWKFYSSIQKKQMVKNPHHLQNTHGFFLKEKIKRISTYIYSRFLFVSSQDPESDICFKKISDSFRYSLLKEHQHCKQKSTYTFWERKIKDFQGPLMENSRLRYNTQSGP